MNRIDQIFTDLRASGRKALMPFLTAGDPDIATTAGLLKGFQAAGASIVEVGIPFSDPVADGPVIQASMTRALDGGATVQDTFEAVASVRDQLSMGVVAMVSYSIVYRIGLDAFCKDAVAAGFDGFIFPDVPVDEAQNAQDAAAKHGGILSQLIAPTTPLDRAQTIAANSSGFAYVVSRSGITGEQKALPTDLPDRLKALRDVTDIPMAVGFGVSNAQQVRDVVSVADAAIVGSAIVRRVEECAGSPTLVADVSSFVESLAGGLVAEPASA